MYKKTDREQLSFEEFMHPFGGKLPADKRWVKTAKLMPWDVIEDTYEKSFSPDEGRPSIKARIAFGTIYIKEQENLVDERTVEYIAENPYMQHFLGLPEFKTTPLFDSSMMVHFRKRFNAEAMKIINETLYKNMYPKKKDDDNTPPPDSGTDKTENYGKLVPDATAAPSDIRYPTDFSLPNECRENTEVMIDEKKLSKRRLDRFRVIEKTYLQQLFMYNSNIQKCDDRIINQRQPHVRCIMRGKAGKRYEFGQKLRFSVVDGFTFIDDQKWDNYNEGICLKASAERYKERIGVYPEAIFADTNERCAFIFYRNKDNRKFCKENGIRLSGPKLGRPKASEAEADKELAYKDSCERNIVQTTRCRRSSVKCQPCRKLPYPTAMVVSILL